MIKELNVVYDHRYASGTKFGRSLSVGVRARSNCLIVNPNSLRNDACRDFDWDVGRDLWANVPEPSTNDVGSGIDYRHDLGHCFWVFLVRQSSFSYPQRNYVFEVGGLP